jgi:deoxycytidylate deaminase
VPWVLRFDPQFPTKLLRVIHAGVAIVESCSWGGVMEQAAADPGFAPEIYVALCGAAGTDLNAICKSVAKEFATYGYHAEVIGLSALFAKIGRYKKPLSTKFEDDRIAAAMDAGNEIRETLGSGDAAVRLAIAAIREFRSKDGSPDKARQKTVYIIKSIKNKEEYKTLSRLYKDAFFMISIYEPKESRIKNLKRLIAKTKRHKIEDCHDRAVELIDRDDKESGNELGQGVRDAFQLGDVFVEINKNIDNQISRVINLAFGAPFITPSKIESSMFHAYAASLRSADLARQVGAVVVNTDGDVISEGCNEVPKVGGGVIWEEEVTEPSQERRDFGLGYDSTSVMKREILQEVIKTLRPHWFKERWLKEPTNH